MAQTKRKRRTKHRGNAAGMVEVRGRTSRPSETGKNGKPAGRRAASRLDRPPSWQSAINRAAITTVLFVVAMVLLLRRPLGAGLALGAIMFFIYIPLGYYTDQFVYRRRIARRSAPKK
jgi:hypothetical protein